MISFSLICKNNHEFEVWFRTSEDYEFQLKKNLISCPNCNNTFIQKALMAPAVKSSKKFGLFLWKFFDLKIIDGFGPDGISSIIKKFSVKANKFQSGYIYQYAFVMLIGFSALLTFLIVK